jgi:2-phospho-L-lactate guanylyltransferase
LPRPSLNRDLRAFARVSADGHPLVVLLADLPALTVAELAAALTECAAHRLAFAPDQDGSGTTLLYSREPSQLHPAFGEHSAHRHHRTGAHPLTQIGPGLRRDVDTLADLVGADALGVGVSTRAEINDHIDLLFPDRHDNDERRPPAWKI